MKLAALLAACLALSACGIDGEPTPPPGSIAPDKGNSIGVVGGL